jgi:hypothetical protein
VVNVVGANFVLQVLYCQQMALGGDGPGGEAE